MDGDSVRDLGWLLVSVGRLHHTRADQAVQGMGLYRGQAVLLMVLSRGDGLTHSEIANILEFSPAAATKIIKRMEQEGYVRREADPDDERVSRVYLLDKGRAMIEEIRSVFAALNHAMFEGIPEADLAQLRHQLTCMQANLQNYQP